MKRFQYIFVIASLFSIHNLHAQIKPAHNDTTSIAISNIEVEAEFIGGDDALIQFLEQNIVYPPKAMRENIQGTVKVEFIVDIDGKVTDVTVKKSVNKELDKEAIRVLGLSDGKWKPGLQNGKRAKSYHTVPISFVLQ